MKYEDRKIDRILDVRNLRISFKTNTGTVKAVRGIDFALYKGKTLAIVGESGSGKSVTSKAILGILANNKIIEDGRIIYDGKDLLTLPEKKFTKIRGVKISMIFQDPLSALNPIMKVGKQLTEAMYLEGKSLRREAKKYVKTLNNQIKKYSNGVYVNEILKDCKQAVITEAKNLDDVEKVEKVIRNKYLGTLRKTAEGETEIFKQNLRIALEEIEKYRDAYLPSDIEKFDMDLAKKNIKPMKKALANCQNFFASEPDDIIDVHITLLLNYFKSIKQSIENQKHIDEVFAKFGVDNIYDLPASQRTKEREIITSKNVYYESIDNITRRIIKHIKELLEQYENINSREFDAFVTYYSKMLVQKDKKTTKEETKARAIELMKEVGIPDPERRFYQYPFEFSGGMRQRIVIAIALSGNPEILICDEPTTALDVTIQAQILELIQRLKVEKNLSIIFITHDLGVVANMADDIAVMYAGKIVEYGSVYDIFYDPRHPYTWALLSSMPDLNTQGKLEAIPGTPPNMLLPPRGDAFAARNNYAVALDYKQEPPFFKVSDTHSVKTWLAHPNANDVMPPKTVINRIKHSLENNPDNMPRYELKKNSVLEIIKGGK